MIKFLTYLKNAYLSRCCEGGWRSYICKGDGKYVWVDPRHFDKSVAANDKTSHFHAFIADPFLFQWSGVNYLFFETVGPESVESGLKGKIGCLKEVNGKWINLGIVLEQPWHMSYPQVFEENGHIYMIPEQSALGKGDVSLYEATDFPRGWKKVQTLIDCPFADSTLLRKDGHYYMACYTIPPHETAELWHAPSLLGPWERHPQWQNIHQNAKYRRCGGAFLFTQTQTDNPAARFSHLSSFYRIAQDCDGGYGLRLYKVPVLNLSPEHYIEGEPILLIDKSDFIEACKHTYNEIMIGGEKISVFDCHWRTRLPLKQMAPHVTKRLWMKISGKGEV